MKVLIISDVLAYGGASKLINDMVPRLILHGCKCELLIWSDKNAKYIDSLKEQHISVTVIPETERSHLKSILFIRNFIRNGKYDVVHVNLFPVLYYCSIVKRMLGNKAPKFIYTEHSTDNKRRHKKLLQPVEQYIYSPYERIVSISDKTRENVIDWLKPKQNQGNKFLVIPNGIPLEAFKGALCYKRTDLIPSYTNEKLLLMVGSFTDQKNHSFMLRVMTQLPDNYFLLLVGEGPLKAEIVSTINDLNLENRVHLFGFRKDIPQIMKTADVVVIPSKWEGFGLIAAEAMAAGIPIVASNVPGLADVVGDAGIRADNTDEGEFASAIMKFEDDNYRKEIVSIEIERSTQFDIEKTAWSYLKLYEDVLHCS